jgi:hypothetical protein
MSRMRTSKSPDYPRVAWAVALRLGTFGWAEIARDTGIAERTVKAIIREWEQAGAVQPTIKAHGHRNQWQVDKDFVWPKVPNGTAEERMWLAMRKLGSFQPSELAHSTHDEAVPVSEAAASAYCQMLLEAGYLMVTRRAAPLMQRQAHYRLVKPTGIVAPVRRLIPAIYDANTGDVHVLNQGGQA